MSFARRGAIALGRRWASEWGSAKGHERLSMPIPAELRNIGAGLTVRMVVLDLDLIGRAPPPGQEDDIDHGAIASGRFMGVHGPSFKGSHAGSGVKPVEQMLTGELRAELRSLGLDGTGKPWALQARLRDARGEAPSNTVHDAVQRLQMPDSIARKLGAVAAEGAVAGSEEEIPDFGMRDEEEASFASLRAAAAATAPLPPDLTAAAAEALACEAASYAREAAMPAQHNSDLRSRYMAKLKARTGSSGPMLSDQLDRANKREHRGSSGDADILSTGRSALRRVSAEEERAGGKARWAWGLPGMARLARYLKEERGMMLAIVPRPSGGAAAAAALENL